MITAEDGPAAKQSVPPRMKRRRCPTILQMEAAECGAAALAMVMAHHGLWVPLEELRVACGVSRDGSKAGNLVRAATRFGLEAKGWRVEPAQLGQFPLPAILFWEFNHFVVLEGVGRGKVYLNDPATGPRTVSFEEFSGSFTGVLLTFQPTAAFAPAGRPQSPWRSLVHRLSGARDTVALIALVSIFLVVPGIVVPAFAKVFVDDVLARGLTDWLKPLLIGMALTALLRIGLSLLQETQLLRLQLKLGIDAATQLVRHMLRLPMPFFTQRYAGDLAARIDANERLARMLSGQTAGVAFNLVSLIFFAAVMLLYDVPLTLIGVSLSLLNLLALHWVARRREDASRQLLRDEARLEGVSMNGIQLIETLKAMGIESDFFVKWSGQQAKVLNGRQRLESATYFLNAVPPLLGGLTTALVLGYGGLRAMEGHITIGTLVAFQSLLASFSAPIVGLIGVASQVQVIKGDLERLDDVLRHPLDPRFADGCDDAAVMPDGRPTLAGAVEFRAVTFGYSPLQPPLIEGLDLRLEPGRWVALVGPSGSGKSTVAKLLTGVNRPWSGDILLDGLPLDAIPRRVVASSLAAVSQEVFLFEGTVRDNLTLWDPTVPEADVVAAATDACIHDVIATRPGGYSGPVAEGGANLSGGQAQRMEIARALANRPSVLVLDEATSALDPLTEERILENLRRRGCSVVIVAHRLSTIRDCDEIIVLDEGKVVQRGTHEALMAEPGAYAELIRAE